MPNLLFVVTEVFTITSRGVVIGTGPIDKIQGLKPGNKLSLLRPDGCLRETRIRAIVDHRMAVPPSQGFGILLPVEFGLKDVPIGTEVRKYDDI